MRKNSKPAKVDGNTAKEKFLTVILYIIFALISATGLHFPIDSCIEHEMERRENEMQIAVWWELYDEYTMFVDSSTELKFLEHLEMDVKLSIDYPEDLEKEKIELLDCIRGRISEIESEEAE